MSTSLDSNNVHVKMLLSPINPADINQIEGTYAFIPERPFIAGNEGLGQVLSVGNGVGNLKEGDWVVPAVAGLGTWRSELVCPSGHLMQVPNDIPKEAAATILVNPCTAYRMLEDFVALRPGDCIIQNGANSAVGRAVIQLAARRGVQTISVVRDRPEFEELERELRDLGSTMVVKAERLVCPDVQEHIVRVTGKKPILGLNCVGGQPATDMARSLAPGGTLVTYGGMSKKPVTIPTGLLIFNDLRFTGFWVSAWYKKQRALELSGDMTLTWERERMMSDLFGMIREGKLQLTKCRMHRLEAWQKAIAEATSSHRNIKEMFEFP